MSSREEWQRRLGPLYGGAVALVHSTPWRWPTEVGEEPRSSGWMVALGLPVGFVAWLVAAAVQGLGVATPVAALLGLAMLSLASAAIVERGVAERVDRWQGEHVQGARSPAALLVVMFATLIRAAAVVFVPPRDWLLVFLATAVVGRWAAAFLQALGDPIVTDGRQRSLVAVPAPLWLTAAVGAAVAALAVLALGKVGLVAVALAALAAFGLGLEAQRRDGGLSAPVVAVAAVIGELLVLVVATIGTTPA